jgi:hypothetical protein
MMFIIEGLVVMAIGLIVVSIVLKLMDIFKGD